MSRFLWICAGGALGTGARYLVSGWVVAWLGARPYGTFAVNVTGSFLIAAIMQLSQRGAWISQETQVVLTAGVLGGYTTYSSFSYETLELLQAGEWRGAALQVGGTVLGCLAACFLGFALAKSVAGA